MSATTEEIEGQPAAWRRAAALASDASNDLPPAGERLAILGCGTSLYVAQSIASIRESSRQGETDAFTPTEFPAGRRYDAILAISRSGTTTEILRALEEAKGTPTYLITASANAPAVPKAGHAVVIDFADERSVVQTRSATTALALMRSHLGQDLAQALADAEEALRRPIPLDPTDFDQFVFLGSGWSVGIANEAALKIREAAGAWSEAYPATEYRHGPVSVASGRTVVWSLGSMDDDLAAEIQRTGATVILGSLDPMAELIVIQRTAVALAEARGSDPDNPPHLSRSVVLP
jgi:fructoselysine-6-P-deglycase FrlB-like protein